jgi:hypothetical protein
LPNKRVCRPIEKIGQKEVAALVTDEPTHISELFYCC